PSVNPPLSSSPVQPSLVSGGNLPPPLPKSGPTFGTVTVRGSSEELVQPTPTQPAVAPTGPGSITGVAVAKPLATRIQNEIPRTQSAPPLLNLQDSTNAKNVGQPPGHQMNSVTPRTQQQLSTATPLQSISTSNPPHNRKDSVSSTVSSNDGQQPPPFHPHQPQPHHNNYNQQHAHPQYHSRHIHQHHKGPPQGVPNHFQQKNRDRSVPGTIPPSSHSNPQTVPNQAQTPIPLTGPQAAIPVPMWQQYGHGHGRSYESFYPGYYAPTVYMPVLQRPPMQVTHHMQPTVSPYTPPGQKNHAVQIINPADRSVVVPSIQHNTHVPQAVKKEEVPTPTVFDAKRIDDLPKEKEQASDNDKKESKAVRIVDPVERDKIEREKREKEQREENERKERERAEREEKERLEREKKEREEKERLEREEKEKKEREEKERKEREEKERKEREERERKEREERERKEREERERREREEKERKEREERERKEREEKERKEREEKERKEREEKERKEREEKERKEREEQERKEREEKERKEREEKERKEREEKERMEKERLEREEKERREREEAEQREKEQLERNAQERERIEKEEME
ncbi:13893_t:CDS:2, partial [Acaulospora morrowiae]